MIIWLCQVIAVSIFCQHGAGDWWRLLVSRSYWQRYAKATAAPKTQLNDVTVYTFTKNVNINDNFGLQVFKADGSTAFHSSGKPLRVVDFVRRKTHKPDGSRDYDPLTKYYSGYGRLGVVIPSTIAIVTLTGNINAGTALLYPSAKINTDNIVFGYRPRYIPLKFMKTHKDLMILLW